MRAFADRRTLFRLLERSRRAFRREDGLTLIELLVTLAILGIVLAAITGVFMSGLKAEASVANREQAQSDARMALAKMRDDIHCAFDVQSLAANASGGYTLSLTEFANQCTTVASQPGSGSTVYLAWCTVPDPAHPGTFDLYRANGACDATSTLMAAHIVPPASGWPANEPGNVWPVSRTCADGYFKTQAVRLAVNPDTTVPGERYELTDEIALLNSVRSVGCTGPGATAQLVFTTQPTGAVPNAAFPTAPVVTAEDGAGNVVTNYNGTVALSIEAGTGTSGASLTGCSAVNLNGATSFTGCRIDKPGTGYVLVASDGAVSVASNPFNVTSGPATSLTVSGYPSPTGAGVSNTFTVTANDAGGNVATGYTGTIHFTSSDGAAVLPANYTFTAADNGTHTFPATLKTLGTQSITATDTVTSTLTGSQTGITVTAGQAASLAVTGYPSPTVSGVIHNFTVTAKDTLGNVATAYTGTVHFTSTDGAAVLPANYTFTAADNGTHTFPATLKTPGTQSITATDTAASSITGSQNGITVTADATPPTFAITQSGANVTTNGTNTVIFRSAPGGSFTITASDPESGISSTTFPTCPTGWTRTTGTNSVTCTATTSAAAGNMAVSAINNAGATTNLTVTITLDNTAPTVVSSTRVNPSPTNTTGNVSWTVTFSKPVTGVATSNFTFSETVAGTPAVTGVTGSGTTWTVTASTGTGSGTIQLRLTANLANITDSVGNALATAFTTGDTYTFDRIAPTVSSINLVGSTPTHAASVQWTVTFSKSVTGVDSTDFTLPTTGAVSGAAITAVSGSGATYTVTAGTGTGDGTLGLNLVDNDSITDSVGNPLGGPGAGNGNFTGQSYTIDKTAPTPVSAVATDDGNPGQLASKNSSHHDRLALTYSENIDPGSITTGNVSVTFTNNDPACNGSADSILIPGVGKVCLGSQGWLTATSTETESLSLSGSVLTLTITTNPTGNASGVAASNFTWSTSGGTAADLSGNVATGSVTTNSQRF